MSPQTQQSLRNLGRCLAISFAFSLPFSFGMHLPGPSVHPFATAFSFGFPFGLLFWASSRVFDRRLRHRSFIVTLAMQGVLLGSVITLSLCLAMVLYISFASRSWPGSPNVLRTAFGVVAQPWLATAVAIGFAISLAISSVMQISNKLGPGVLTNWILGKYHEPREEERIFMFLDMKDSTTLAERLGNLRFSALVRDFFDDMTWPVIETKGEVSHYIGDEAVLTWKVDRGLQNANCIRCFYAMREAIDARRGHYLSRYGLVPDFKAGIHLGPVISTEVGQVKSEIVYHGDVLNTTARIQGLCNGLDEELLVSEDLVQRLTLPKGHVAISHGEHLLKGKEREVGIVAIRRGTEMKSRPNPEPLPLAN